METATPGTISLTENEILMLMACGTVLLSVLITVLMKYKKSRSE
jgi:hypothetical protein